VVTILSKPAFLLATIKIKKRREEAGPLFASHFEAGETEPLRAFSALNPEEGLVDKIDPFGLVEAKAVQNPA
jgi:hypothetical protein